MLMSRTFYYPNSYTRLKDVRAAMTEDFIVTLGRQALLTVLLVSAPILGMGLLAGVLVSIFQATTQINEQSLSFIPKILVVLVAVVIFGPWMYHTMLEFTQSVFAKIPAMVQ
jgi:flagellar biosynthetic protein FliQ